MSNEQERNLKKQAKMTAWKLLSEWVDIQVTLISVGQAETFEAFFPYLLTNDDSTMFQRFKKERLLLPEGVDERV